MLKKFFKITYGIYLGYDDYGDIIEDRECNHKTLEKAKEHANLLSTWKTASDIHLYEVIENEVPL